MDAYRIAYDGRPFHGFQRQPSVSTVENALFDALDRLGIADAGGDPPPGYAAAGRTDAGVSAVAQTVGFEAPEWCRPRALNAELPADVRAWASAPAPDDFHATRDATRRTYVYHLHAPDRDADGVARLLSALEGTHDFHNLTAVTDPDEDTVRTVHEAGVEREGEFLRLRVAADGFLREMVRRIVGLVEGRTAGDTPGIERVLSGERLTGPEGIAPAPPEPLVLTGVEYPDIRFSVDDRARESLRAIFGARRREALARTRVMGSVIGGSEGDPRGTDDG